MAQYDKADLEKRMSSTIEALKHDLSGLRTGRANTALLDNITVEVYGSNMPLNQVATVSVPEPRMLSIQVWDKGNIQTPVISLSFNNLNLIMMDDHLLIMKVNLGN